MINITSNICIMIGFLLYSLLIQASETCPKGKGPAKFFTEGIDIPIDAQTALESSKPLCVNGWHLDTCITITHLGDGLFTTNQHAWDSFVDIYRSSIKNKGRDKTQITSLDNFGKDTSVFPSPVVRGWWDGDPKGSNNNHSQDLIILSIPELSNFPFVELEEGAGCSIGNNIHIAGFPQGGSWFDKLPHYKAVFSSGEITHLSNENNSGNFLGMNGMSGGPLVNNNGKLCGIFWGKEPTFREEVTLIDFDDFDPSKYTNCTPPEKSHMVPLKWIKSKLELAREKLKVLHNSSPMPAVR